MMTILRAAFTVVLLILFLRLAVWAWSSRRKETFDALARMPLEDDATETKPGTETPARSGRP